jgi:hypothetical protein
MVERDTFINFATCAIDLLSSFIMSNTRASCSADKRPLPPSLPITCFGSGMPISRRVV